MLGTAHPTSKEPTMQTPATATDEIVIRRIGEERGDRAAAVRLAGRDSAPLLRGPLLGAWQEGRLLAAISLSDGELIADPFVPSAAAAHLLQLRADQLRASGRASRRLRLRRRGSRGALPASPPSAGGRLLRL
jgi:hypothetical protein